SSNENVQAAKKFFSAYAETWVGLSPIWLMGEAITGKKVGTRFNKGKGKLFAAADEVRQLVTTNSKDIVVIMDEKLKTGKNSTGKTAEVIKAAGENAVVVITTSLEKFQAEMREEYGPEIKKVMAKNGRDVIVILDNALKHPVVVTGVSQFARSKGIPHADALLRLGSLALSKILRAMPEEVRESEVGKDVEHAVEELDAKELERTSSVEEQKEAQHIGEAAASGKDPKVEDADPYEKMRKKNDCIIM
ncbi:hypothetical protein BD410DRAFT_694623, partial [Rickenella mellea]